MTKIKILVIILVLAFALALTAACGRNNNDDGGDTPDPDNVITDADTTTDTDTGTQDTTIDTTPGGLGGFPPLTVDDVTVTFGTWYDFELARYVADRFTDRHPNIQIEIVETPSTVYHMDNLLTMAAAQSLPDTFAFTNLDVPVNNGWLLDFTDYWFNDPDSTMLLDSLHDHVLIDGRAMRLPEAVFPQVIYLDRNIFNLLNEPMPPLDWVWEDMINLISHMSRVDMGIFGFDQLIGPATWAPIVLNDALSEFGWDGQSYNMYEWARYMNLEAQWERLSYRALSDTDAWEAITGDRHLWPGSSGRVAMQMDAIWTFNSRYIREHYRERNILMVPYAIPMGANAQTNRRPAFIDFAGISATTNHPREAYEALKWMTFHTDAWHYRNIITPQLVTPAGEQIFRTPNRFPLTNDETVWADFRTLFPMDEPAWDHFLAVSREPVPLGGQGILGFAEWYNSQHVYGNFNGVTGISNAIRGGVVDAFDVVQQMEETGRQYHERAIDNFRITFSTP